MPADETGEGVWSYVSDEQIARSKEFCSRASRTAWSYSCSILIGCPKKPTNEANNATGIHISIDGYHFLATAHHVFMHYVDQRQKVDHLHFQAGDLDLDARNRIVYEDPMADIAVLAINDGEAKSLGSGAPFVASEAWPVAPPDVGTLVAFGGYAKVNRVNGESGTINSTFLPLIAYVANASTTHFSVRFERDHYRWEGECLLKSGQAFLGGMSGGPVLLLNNPQFPLVGLVSSGNEHFDVVSLSPLSLVPWRSLVAI